MPKVTHKRRLAHNRIDWSGKTVNQLTVVGPDPDRQGYWLCDCSCGTRCSVGSMELKGNQKSCGCAKHQRAHNWINYTGQRCGKLIPVEYLGSQYWRCLCDCGNESKVSSLNLPSYARNNRGCKYCGRRKSIIGERVGLLVAVSCDVSNLQGEPTWLFQCDCGETITGTVREFHGQGLRSCGCHDDARGSWSCMMGRCYNEKDPRYNSYGARGIRVCIRWHKFENFIADMGERPKQYNLGRKHAEKNYTPSNCAWEHISVNCRDTKNNGMPTKPGKAKGAKPRFGRE